MKTYEVEQEGKYRKFFMTIEFEVFGPVFGF